MRKLLFIILGFLGALPFVSAQDFHLTNPQLIPCNLIRISPPLNKIDQANAPMGPVFRTANDEEEDEGQVKLHKAINPDALPKGIDPAIQKKYYTASDNQSPATLVTQLAGLGYTGVNPSDNNVASGPNHIVQMINNSSSSYIRIWNKAGTVLVNQQLLSSITGVSGGGDPIVLYDNLANRYLVCEFGNGTNIIYICVSQTADPTGSYFVYSFSTPNFPDYFKVAAWGNSYVVTSNENSPAVYAMDRTKMLAGTPTTAAQRFTIPSYPTIGFQAATPVDISGNTNAPANSPALIMRMADDAWTTGIVDRLEIFSFNVDWVNPGNTTLTGPALLPTLPFSTNFCGYTTFSCIPQQGSAVKLDPLREVIMNKAFYRNFGTYEALVCCHVNELDGTSHAGIRWYELRKTPPSTSWVIHQQGTYGLPSDPLHRWMACIAINAQGAIGLGYNVSGTAAFPSMKFTGRKACDPLGEMTEPEQTVIAGAAANASNRWGDYNGMTVDPLDESFWFTANYNPTSQWQTRVANFTVPDCGCTYPTVNAPVVTQPVCPTPSTGTITVNATGSGTLEYSITGSGGTFQTSNSFTGLAPGNYFISVRTQGSNTCTKNYAGNPVVINAPSPGITITAPTITQPACPAPTTGTIVVNATAGGTMEYSINGGTTYQSSNTFSGLTPGSYNIWVRLQSSPGCATSYTGNPVIINPANTAVTTISYTGPAVAIPDNNATGINVILPVSGVGSISDLNFRFDAGSGGTCNASLANANAAVDHTYIGDLVFKLTSPSGTTVTIVNQRGGTRENICTTLLDDDGGYPSLSTVTSASGQFLSGNFAPDNALSAFDGQNANGNWTLNISDVAAQDNGSLRRFSLIFTAAAGCSCTPPTITAPTITQPTCVTSTGTVVVNATGSGTLEYSINGGATYVSSNTFAGLTPGNYNVFVRLQATPTCFASYGSNPVVINTVPVAPVITAPTVTQPTCVLLTGTIVVNATGGGVLEYSLNGGPYQTSNTFSGLAVGNYNITVRLQASPSCISNYSSNPVVLSAAAGCVCTLTCPANITVNTTANQCGAIVTFAATTGSGTCGTITTTPASGSFFNKGTTTVTSTSASGASCSFSVTVVDNQAPSITCPAAINVSCAGAVPAANTALVTATDNCPGVTVAFVNDVVSAQTCANRYTVTRTYRATDAAGLTATCTQTITVNDQTPPTITCPANISLTSATGSCTAIATFVPTATDNCVGAVTITSSPASGTAFTVGVTTVNVTATDVCGNVATCSFTVTVADGQLPVISTPPVNKAACVGNTASFNIVATNAVSYQWQQFNGTAWVNIGGTTATLTLPGVTSAMNGSTYRCNVIGLCTTVTSPVVTLTVNPLPTISLSTSRTPALLPGQLLNITATVNPAGGNFIWYKNGVVIPGATGNVLSALSVDDIGTYKVVYTDPNGCVSTSADIIVTALASNNVFIYPIPNDGRFHIRFYNTVNETAMVNIFDERGAKVYSRSFVTSANPYTRIDVDIHNLSAGTYLVEVLGSGNKRIGAKKIMIGH